MKDKNFISDPILSSVFESVVAVIFFKVYFTRKYIKIIFFYFLKIIFNISASKLYKYIKKILI